MSLWPSVLRTGCEETIIDVSPTTIEFDLPCIECGYNLRGLDPAGKCPECGTDVARTNRGDLLRFSNATWLRRVKLGTDLMLFGIVFGTLGNTAVACVGALLTVVPYVLMAVLSVAASALQLTSIFLITTQEPRTTYSEGDFTWRRVIRTMAIVRFVAELGGQMGLLFVAGWLATLTVLSGVLKAIIIFGFFAYAESFARRIPDPGLARSTTTVKWGLAVCTFATVAIMLIIGVFAGGLFGAAAPVAGPTTTAPAVTAAPATPAFTIGTILVTLFAGMAGLGSFVFAIWALILLIRYRRALRQAMNDAQEITDDPGLAPLA